MKISRLSTIKPFLFSSREVGEALGIGEASARVVSCRYVKAGFLVRLKRDVYCLLERWKRLTDREAFMAANRLQVPSYISLTTALAFYEITTQIQQDAWESVATVRTKTLEAGGSQFRYLKLQPKLYFGFAKKEDFFIALPEKAFLDALYLESLGRYRLDKSALDATRFDRAELKRLSKAFPLDTRKRMEKICKT